MLLCFSLTVNWKLCQVRMSSDTRTILRWSDCELSTESLPKPPDFVETCENESQDFVTSTQIPTLSATPDLLSSPPKKKVCQDKFSKYEALDMVASATNHAEAAQTMLELLAERTFSDISGQDLLELQKPLRSINDQLLQNRLMINRWALILAYC